MTSTSRVRFVPVLALLVLAVAVATWLRVESRSPPPTPPLAAPSVHEPAVDARETVRGPRGDTPRRDLERDEQAGGHTLARHVGRSDAALAARLDRETSLAAASSFLDRETAERAVGRALAARAGRVAAWRDGGRRPDRLALTWEGDGRVVGRVLERGHQRAISASAVRVVLERAGRDGDFVLTAYPEARP